MRSVEARRKYNAEWIRIDHKTRPTGAFNAKKQMHGSKLYRALLKGRVDICDFQLFCANCNQVKRAENNEIGINHGSQQPPQAVSQLSPQEE